MQIDTARVLVNYRMIVKDSKSTNGRRTLPLDLDTTAALRALWVHQASERLAVGPDHTDDGRVVRTARPSGRPRAKRGDDDEGRLSPKQELGSGLHLLECARRDSNP